MKNRLLYDQNSRYNDIDNTKIIFLTPQQVFDLDIGFDKSTFKPDEYNDLFPFLLETLEQMIEETTYGATNGSEIAFPVNESNSKVYFCIEINGKLCKLESEEWDITNNFHGLPVETQIKVFQRLIHEGQITLEDLATEDIDNMVYKKLMVNQLVGPELCKEKTDKLYKIYDEQCKDKKLVRRKEKIINNL